MLSSINVKLLFRLRKILLQKCLRNLAMLQQLVDRAWFLHSAICLFTQTNKPFGIKVGTYYFGLVIAKYAYTVSEMRTERKP